MEKTESSRDIDLLTALNHDYVSSMQKGDVKRFEEILADDFMCSNPDGSLIDKATFLKLLAQGVPVKGLQEDDVCVRVIGSNFASIHARITYIGADGEQHVGRYTDDWARRDGTWECVSAHVTGSGRFD
ncbi:protein of unknown function [Singulisphaera sp. GP187]|uniref:nuclear transport factor 2 family protein n=1 Tax=Singulisphaera sp. GP187 TaxID=1882752 RepID=UPI000928EB10|nr:nuclear transport factor 2 family protein [Singulisphaera sp. GP187]SIO27721.1 protein of unknown function [Singulisphaera sp. GP187]